MNTAQEHLSIAIATGRKLYQDRQFEQAIKVLNDAWELCRVCSAQDKISLLDMRCSTFVKLGQLDTALRDAKTMVRLDKTDGRGYCRAGSVCKIQKQYENAAKWFRHGVTHIEPKNALLDYLQSQLQDVEELAIAQIIYEKAVDPLTRLPLELVEFVLSCLPYTSIISMLRVSKSWGLLLARMEPLVSTVHFNLSKNIISPPMMKAALRRLSRPRYIYIEKLATVAAVEMTKTLTLWSKTKTLDTLHIDNPSVSIDAINFSRFGLRSLHLGLNHKLTVSKIVSIIDACRTLENATFRRVIVRDARSQVTIPEGHLSLRQLELGNQFDLAAFSLPHEGFANYPSLEHLTVNGASYSSRQSWDLSRNVHLRKLDTYACLIRSIRLPVELRHWYWDGCETRSFLLSTRDSDETDLSLLRSVCFSGENTIAALAFLSRCHVGPDQLERIGLHFRQQAKILSDPQIPHEILRAAREVSFESESLQDDDAAAFISQFPDVKILQLAAPRITGAFIAALLRRTESAIEKLVLRDCRNVSPDTLDWARLKGIHVEVHRGSIEVRGGRRLREGWF